MPLSRRLFFGVALGIIAAAIVSAVATAIYIANGLRFVGNPGVHIGPLLVVYLSAGVVGGAVFGLLLPVTRWRFGAVVAGMAALTPMYVGIGILIGDGDVASGLIAAAVVGGLVGYGMWSPAKGRSDSA